MDSHILALTPQEMKERIEAADTPVLIPPVVTSSTEPKEVEK
jgi:hypothetical protein